MTKKFEDYLHDPNQKILKFAEYRKGSSEYGQLFQDLKMLLLLKYEQNKDTEDINRKDIILTKNDIKNLDIKKLKKLSKDTKIMRSIGMSFDMEFLPNGNIRFYNLDNVDKNSRPWENLMI
jgi:hypothetical protein